MTREKRTIELIVKIIKKGELKDQWTPYGGYKSHNYFLHQTGECEQTFEKIPTIKQVSEMMLDNARIPPPTIKKGQIAILYRKGEPMEKNKESGHRLIPIKKYIVTKGCKEGTVAEEFKWAVEDRNEKRRLFRALKVGEGKLEPKERKTTITDNLGDQYMISLSYDGRPIWTMGYKNKPTSKTIKYQMFKEVYTQDMRACKIGHQVILYKRKGRKKTKDGPRDIMVPIKKYIVTKGVEMPPEEKRKDFETSFVAGCCPCMEECMKMNGGEDAIMTEDHRTKELKMLDLMESTQECIESYCQSFKTGKTTLDQAKMAMREMAAEIEIQLKVIV